MIRTLLGRRAMERNVERWGPQGTRDSMPKRFTMDSIWRETSIKSRRRMPLRQVHRAPCGWARPAHNMAGIPAARTWEGSMLKPPMTAKGRFLSLMEAATSTTFVTLVLVKPIVSVRYRAY